ncbi:MAG: hypothetical protein HY059_07480 [Proteobacteria bacterium]|nr:hypothetical protein [Pseudomonadota bacterium]
MQRSFGEQSVMINSSHVGLVRVLNAYAYPAIYPCLGVTLGILLTPSRQRLQGVPAPTDFQLRALHGELRLSELVDRVGLLQWAGERRPVPSDGHEQQVTMCCELDPWRVQRIETWRDGQSPKLWLQLWPSLEEGGERHHAEVRAFAAEVPQPLWLQILKTWGEPSAHLLEVPYADVDAERFTQAVSYVETATAKIALGDYDAAVAACRLAIDAMFKQLAEEGSREEFAAYLSPRIPEARGREYAALLRALKNITHAPHHIGSGGSAHLRAEAVFATQTVQHLLALVGSVRSSPRQ